MRDTRGNRERKKEKERERERASEYQNVVVNREGEEEREAEKETTRVGARREREAFGQEVEKGRGTRCTEGEESGPFDGAFVGSRGALRFATKIVALPACAGRALSSSSDLLRIY